MDRLPPTLPNQLELEESSPVRRGWTRWILACAPGALILAVLAFTPIGRTALDRVLDLAGISPAVATPAADGSSSGGAASHPSVRNALAAVSPEPAAQGLVLGASSSSRSTTGGDGTSSPGEGEPNGGGGDPDPGGEDPTDPPETPPLVVPIPELPGLGEIGGIVDEGLNGLGDGLAGLDDGLLGDLGGGLGDLGGTLDDGLAGIDLGGGLDGGLGDLGGGLGDLGGALDGGLGDLGGGLDDGLGDLGGALDGSSGSLGDGLADLGAGLGEGLGLGSTP